MFAFMGRILTSDMVKIKRKRTTGSIDITTSMKRNS
jgi:hypothetical protein